MRLVPRESHSRTAALGSGAHARSGTRVKGERRVKCYGAGITPFTYDSSTSIVTAPICADGFFFSTPLRLN
jgi:hypothetical protein